MKLFDNRNAYTWSMDRRANLLTMSTGLKNRFGCTSKTLSDNPNRLLEIVYIDDHSLFNEHMEKLCKGHASSIEHRILIPSGELRWVQSVGIPDVNQEDEVERINGVILDLSEQRSAQKQLEIEFISLQAMLKTVDVSVWCYDMASQKILFMSDAITTITGYPIEWFKDMRAWTDIIHKEDAFYSEQITTNVRQGKPDFSEYRIVHANGETRWIQVRIIPSQNEFGLVERLDGTATDITSRKMIEDALNRSEQRYKSLFEYNSDVVCELDPLGNLRAINPAAENITGERWLDDQATPCLMETFGVQDVLLMTDHFQQALHGHSPQYNVTSQHKNGKVYAWEMKNIPIYVDNQVMGVYTIARDISIRKEMEKALQESEERYRKLVELSPIAIAIYKGEEITYINPAGAEMLGLGFKRDTSVNNLMDWVHPKYRDYVSEHLENTVLNGYCPPSEYQIVRSDNQVIDISLTSIYDSVSSSIQFMFDDITARKQAERALLESEEFNRRLIELSPEAIVLHSSYKFIYVNLAGLALFGVSSLSELIGKSIFEVIPPNYIAEVIERLDGIYKQPSVSPLSEQQILRMDGEVVDVEVIASTIPYKGANAGITLFRDIRDRKKAEEQRQRTEQMIRESEERYYRLQTSLDRLSHDLFGVMKVSLMEDRLLQEIRDVLKITKVSFIEVEQNHDRLCEIMETEQGYSMKIGELKGKSYLLQIDEKPITLEIASTRVWLVTITRYVSVLLDNFLLIEDLTNELAQTASRQIAPPWLLRFLFKLSENERKHLAQDLHDAALQEQIIWYRKLDLLLEDDEVTGDIREKLGQIAQGLLDVIYQIRISCNELRPPMLMKEGLITSLEALFEFTQLRANYQIQFDTEYFECVMNDDFIIGLYRIVQELLANATKHSSATEVRILLSNDSEYIRLEYGDNGVGMDVTGTEDCFTSMGIYGMRERVRSMEGTIQFHSAQNNGLKIFITIPVH
ncbi:PAS domain S-box protein [Cohnella sp. WQ 127256]|uniref:sensor histidine kinase n=1 Tax=Cohnella sp. WQ 127256 TaxID=2938790 RepID=UPI0021184096|nr:PAS domain S-box protein [Cohnella sp. WQ 127256]